MRVLVIVHGHPDFSIGGTEIAAHNLYRGLRQCPGVEAWLLARACPPIARHPETPLMSLHHGERESFFHADAYDPFWLSNRDIDDLGTAMRRYIETIRPDVVHVHHVLGLGVELLQLARSATPDALLCVTFHEFLAICPNHGQMVRTRSNRLCRRASPTACALCFPDVGAAAMLERELFVKAHFGLADAFIGPSRFLIERYVEWGLPAGKFHLLENGLDLPAPTPPRPLAAGGRRARFGYFGQITEFKGLHVLLDAIQRIPESTWGNDAALCIFGGNVETQPEAFQARFARLLDDAGPRAKFYGGYDMEELPRLIRQVDWVIVPSIWWENSPLVIQEAFAHGRPVICGDIGGMAEKVRHEVDGLQFRAGSAEDLADCLLRVLAEPDLWQRLRARTPRPLDYRTAAQQHEALYAALRAARSRDAAPPSRGRLRLVEPEAKGA